MSDEERSWEEEESQHTQELIARYEQELESGNNIYIDSDDIEQMYRYYIENRQIDKAERLVNYGMQLHPSDDILPLFRAQLYIEHFEPQKAIDLLKQKPCTDNFFYYYLLTIAMVNIDRIDEAQHYADLGMRTSSNDEITHTDAAVDMSRIFFENGHYDVALKYLLTTDAQKEKDVEALMGIARCYSMLNETQKSIEYIDKILDIDPYDVEAWSLKATLHLDIEQVDEALDDLEYALAIAPDSEELHIARIKTLTYSLRYDEALQAISELQTDQPHTTNLCHMLRGDIYFFRNDFNTAHRFYKKGFDNEFFFMDSALRYLTAKLELHRWKETIKLGNYLLSFMPDNTDIIEKLSDAHFELGENDKSAKLLRKCMQIHPKDTRYALRYGSLMLDMNEIEKAYRAIHKAYKINSNDKFSTVMMALVCYIKNYPKRMYLYLHQAEQISPDSRELFFRLCPESKEYIEKVDELIKRISELGVEDPIKYAFGNVKL